MWQAPNVSTESHVLLGMCLFAPLDGASYVLFNCFLGRYAVSKVLSAKPLFVAMCPKSQGLLIP